MDKIIITKKIEDYDLIKNFVIFGASTCIDGVVALLKKKSKNICFLVDNDNNKVGTYVNGYEVKDVKELRKLDKNIGIIIASAYQKEIYEQLLSMNLRNPIFPYIDDLMYDVYKEAKDYIYDLSIIQKFEDEDSKEYLKSIINFRKSLDITEIKFFTNAKVQYIHPHIAYEKIDGNILDIGAYDGDSMKTFYNYCPNVSKIYAIEPQSNNFEALKNNIKKLNYSNKVIPIKYAISNIDDEKVFIDVQESLSSTAQVNIQGENENFIFTKTLDSLYKNENIDLIKMDIEGFEMNALQGAKEIIKNQTPTLILSAYHKNRDIYDFIDFVESLSTDYKLFCFHHPLTHHEIEYYFINKKLHKD